MSPRRIGLATLAALACTAAPALAEPAFTATLSTTATSFTWEGNPGSGFNKTEVLEYTPCGSPNRYCEDVLVELEAVGQLTAQIVDPEEPADDDTANTHDLDLHLFESDASGTEGKQLASTNSTSASEKITKKALPVGYYLVRVDYYRGVNISYDGTLTFAPAESALAPAAPVAAPVAAPAPKPPAAKKAKKPNKKKYAACKRKAKRTKSAKKRKKALRRCAKKYRR